ncbi:hypothetical protein OE88DRAFT_382498 [Heliocybe sulcata]|uniref:Uncharacterized protein n=1 Tax=Heliocybe sulcata TaxID=5364 RepID=A0A5C3MY01_9AGAM|nr:hypothetical protein OE88DRAFT_382498 [Heliocybe sulcata]
MKSTVPVKSIDYIDLVETVLPVSHEYASRHIDAHFSMDLAQPKVTLVHLDIAAGCICSLRRCDGTFTLIFSPRRIAFSNRTVFASNFSRCTHSLRAFRYAGSQLSPLLDAPTQTTVCLRCSCLSLSTSLESVQILCLVLLLIVRQPGTVLCCRGDPEPKDHSSSLDAVRLHSAIRNLALKCSNDAVQ